jgi:peroxiredoxin Q/BCP
MKVSSMLAIGSQAPDFSGLDHQGRLVRLSEVAGRGPVILYFYPKDFTFICTREACHFRDAYAELHSELGAEIIGVSLDDVGTHRRFATKHDLPFPLVGDEEKEISSVYDVLHFFGLFAKRVTYLIGSDRIIYGMFHHEFSAKKHLDEVRVALRSLRDATV